MITLSQLDLDKYFQKECQRFVNIFLFFRGSVIISQPYSSIFDMYLESIPSVKQINLLLNFILDIDEK
jgi:hypothetical protein